MAAFAFALCRELGIAHPRLLADQITAGELLDWWIAYQEQPWGELRADLRSTATLAVFSGLHGWQTIWPYTETEDEIIADLKRIREENRGDDSRIDD